MARSRDAGFPQRLTKRLPVVAVLLLACAGAAAADKLAPLDAEFLEYLAGFEDDEEDWALFADEEPAPKAPPVRSPVAKRDASKTEDADKPAQKR